jgi:hypothetical protein
MDPELLKISGHMKDIGLGVLSQAQKNAFFMDYITRLNEGVFSVIQAAHAAELLIKACIAEQHPLLIFSQLPKSINIDNDLLNFPALFDSGRTLEYNELPERLWATTGYKIPNLGTYNSFGKLRNGIQHFAVPNVDFSQLTGEFIYTVIDPILEKFWRLYAVEYCDDEEPEINLVTVLIHRKIKFRYPEKWKENVEEAIRETQKWDEESKARKGE